MIYWEDLFRLLVEMISSIDLNSELTGIVVHSPMRDGAPNPRCSGRSTMTGSSIEDGVSIVD